VKYLKLILSFILLLPLCLAQDKLPQQEQSQSNIKTQESQINTDKPLQGFGLADATPVKIRLNRNVSSADAHIGDTVDFDVLEEVRVNNVLVIPIGSLAYATVTQAEHKKRMARGGKLDINIDYVKLANGQKAALRAVQGGLGGGHVGAMTGAIVATSLVFWPAAPFFYSCTVRT